MNRPIKSTYALLAASFTLALLMSWGVVADDKPGDKTGDKPDSRFGVVKCANLIHGKTPKSSKCFSAQFMIDVERDAHIKTTRKFDLVKLESTDLYDYPFAVMSGEGAFTLTQAQRENLFSYLTRGGFLVASPGCSDENWTRSFLREMKTIFPDNDVKKLEMSHEVFHTVYDIRSLNTKRRNNAHLSGLEIDGRIVMIYSPDGLNDTGNAGGKCCCCGGNEIKNAKQVNVNLLAYALTH